MCKIFLTGIEVYTDSKSIPMDVIGFLDEVITSLEPELPDSDFHLKVSARFSSQHSPQPSVQVFGYSKNEGSKKVHQVVDSLADRYAPGAGQAMEIKFEMKNAHRMKD